MFCSGLQKKILVDEAHAVGKFLQARACDVHAELALDQRTTRALPPFMSFSTSLRVAIDVSPGVVDASAP